MTEIAPGTLIDGRYKVISRLGSGGMADVFCAEDQQLGRKIALKLLHRRFSEDPAFVERFRREAQAAAGLQHPNVVSVYDRGAYDGTYYIAMEYLPGSSLKQLIRDQAPLEPVRAIDITIQILRAARFAHGRGVIHRDLKPHNVIVDDGDHAKVTDFGIARAGASDMTETGSIMGTAQYLSPEQAQGHSVSAASDLYAVGVVLYELLTGRVPFDAEAAVTIALKHVSEPPPPPSASTPNIPPELDQIVLWTLNKDPTQRPADADQLIAALEHARATILAGRGGQHTADMPALAIVWPPVSAAEAAPATVLSPAAPAPDPAANEAIVPSGPPGPPPGPHSELRRSRRWPWWALLALLIAGAAIAGFLISQPSKKVVPTVVNETLSLAQTQLQNAGFGQSLIYVSDRHPAGTVIGQDPLGGTKADSGSNVTLKVSNGPGNKIVPSVNGLSAQQARQAIRQAGLQVARVQSETSDQIAAGTATHTEPGAGTPLPLNSGVTLFVSSGLAPVSVPAVEGQSKEAASATLVAKGFVVSTTTQDSTTVTPGNVISQSPAGGSKQPPGTTINLVIAKAPTTATVPSVTGNTASAAASTLTTAGFKVSQTTKDVTVQSQNGIVQSQSPAANSTAPKGSTVSIVLGNYKAPKTPTGTTPKP